MATSTVPTAFIDPNQDVVRRNIKRELPCKLTEEEFTRISRQRVAKEAELAQLREDLAVESRKRKDQIEEVENEVGKMGRELHLEQQDRTVPCNEVFLRGADGTGWIHTIRLDTGKEVERRPASAHETQRYLPNLDGSAAGGLLDDAQRAQRSAQDDASDVPEGGADGDDADDDSDEAGEGGKKRRKGKRS